MGRQFDANVKTSNKHGNIQLHMQNVVMISNVTTASLNTHLSGLNHKVCAVPACKCPDPAIVCKIADKHYIQSMLNIPTTSNDETMLCPYHYHVVYRSLPGKVESYSRTRCTICKKDLSGRSDHHHCPSPQVIRQHLQEKTGHDHEISPDGIICTTCYKVQMSILQGECISKDFELMQVMARLETQETSQSAIEKAVNNSLNPVGRKVPHTLLKQEALLLPDVYDTFCECFDEAAEQQNLPAEVSPNDLVTKQQLLSYLKVKLGKHLA